MGEDNVRETFELINDNALLAVKLLAVLIHSLLGDLSNPGQSVVEFFVRVAPVGDVGDSGERREDDGFLEIVVTLEMAAELKHISKSVLDRCGLGSVGQGVENASELTTKTVMDGGQVVRVVAVEGSHS